MVYFLGIGNLLYGVDADIREDSDNHSEHMRRVAEVAHLFLDAGLILVFTAIDFNLIDRDILTTMIDPSQLITVWVGDSQNPTLNADLHVDNHPDESTHSILELMQSRGLIFSAW